MPRPDLPPAVAEFFAATNAADRDRFLATFAEDAVLDDWGRQFDGREAIAQWNETDNIGVSSQIAVVGVQREGDAYRAEIQVTGDGYNGGGAMTFQLDDGRIARVDITG